MSVADPALRSGRSGGRLAHLDQVAVRVTDIRADFAVVALRFGEGTPLLWLTTLRKQAAMSATLMLRNALTRPRSAGVVRVTAGLSS